MAKMGSATVLLAVSIFVLTCVVNVALAQTNSRREVNGATAKRSRCVSCSANGQTYEGHTRFQYEKDCHRFRCVCYCNGTWVCPSQHTENICEENEGEGSSSSHASSSSSSQESSRQDGRCRACTVNGEEHPGNSYFQHAVGCITYDQCVCHCNGSWECPASRAMNTCEDGDASAGGDEVASTLDSARQRSGEARRGEEEERRREEEMRRIQEDRRREEEEIMIEEERRREEEERRIVEERREAEARRQAEERRRIEDKSRGQGVCSSCQIGDKEFRGNTYFQLDQDCTRYKYCFCHCNSSWNCPQKYSESICDSGEDENKPNSCSSCSVRGKTFTGNSSFEMTSSCIHYKNCFCNCDGAWACPDSSARRVCERESDPSDSDGDQSCRTCEVKGKQYPANDYFDHTDGCVEYKNCICHCNGSWVCPGSGARNICASEESTNSQSSCRQCDVRGKQYPGNNYFEFTEGCMEYKNCICNCNGSWQCPDSGARNICAKEDSGESDRGCKKCSVSGKLFNGNSYFEHTEGCIEYKNCICACDGSWKCPESGSKNICTLERRRPETPVAGSCRQCEVKGQLFPASDYFDYRDGCTEYRNCVCNCDGTWYCPPNAARDVCENTDSSCKTCEVYGTTFPGNEYFQVKDGCYEYKNCICYCNGSWICPDNSVRYTCSIQETTQPPTTPIPTTRQVSSECASCLAYGARFRGNSYFNVTSGCTSYRNCVCRCSGAWQCPASSATNICTEEARTETPRPPQTTQMPAAISRSGSTQCLMCNAKNKVVKGNSYFELRDGCTEYKNCICRCNGSWHCPTQYARNICPVTTAPVEESCRYCVARGKIVNGNSNFDLTEGCIHYRDCRCSCDGSWECPPQRSQNICFNNGTDSTCSICQASDGRVYQPNSKFQFTQDCIQYSCDCFCNGSWNCPAEKSRWVCTDKCRQCNVEGRKIQNDTVFTHRTGCLEYTCNCFCNGSWSCPGSTVKNTCPAGVKDNCNKCKVGSDEHEGETDFVLRRDCLQYRCRCNCDGSYSCPGKEARNVCRGETLGGCRSCVVSDSEYYKGESNFTLRKDCLHFSCRCNCDGSWSCPGELARDVCLGEVPGGCRVCRVSESERYAANTVFDMRKGCMNYRCKCKCDGSWSCPGEDVRDICKGEIPGGCRSCVISENEYYPGNTNFEMVKNCLHYKCRCNCDGSYNCPGKQTRRVCKVESEAERPTCRTCRISESEQYNGNATFILERGCNRYECTCNCDGSWVCPATKTRDICNRPTGVTQCKPCKIGTEVYPGNSAFKFTRRCNQFDCNCTCSGRWSCDHKNPVNICVKGEQDTAKGLKSNAAETRRRQTLASTNQEAAHSAQSGGSDSESDIRSQQRERETYRVDSSNCRSCSIDGRTIKPNQLFSVARGCTHHRNCLCNCDGTWQCEEETNTCGDRASGDAGSSSASIPPPRREGVPITAPKKSTVELDSSAWVYVDGKDISQVKKTDDQTGGGYAVQIDARYRPVGAPEASPYQQGVQLDSRSPYIAAPQRSSPYSVSHSSTRDEGNAEENSQCQSCSVDSNTYRVGEYFDMRRGCVIYKCQCKCNGNYGCLLTSDNACTPEEKQSTCGNCIFNGMVYPGNRGFTVRDGCFERECECKCDGTHQCHKSTPLVGCGVPAIPVFRTPTGNAVYRSSCTNCDATSGSAVVYHHPVMPVSGNEGSGLLPFLGSGYRPGAECSGCSVDGTMRAGDSTFTFVKECIEFTCYCACGGSWKCSGIQAMSCRPRFETGTVTREAGCTNCLVKGRVYSVNTQITIQQGCNEYQCTCGCNGQLTCPNQQPSNICPTEPRRELDPLIAREDPYASDQGDEKRSGVYLLGELRQSANVERPIATDDGNCFRCDVRGEKYQPKSKFFLRDGCMQRVCECHCDSSWSCSDDQMVDICKAEASERKKSHCQDCVVNGEVYISEKEFQINTGCYQSSCHCFCNGSHVCPAEGVRNICALRTAPKSSSSSVPVSASGSASSQVSVGDVPERPRIHSTVVSVERDEPLNAASFPGCRECEMDGQKVLPLSSFIRQLGCTESVCHCLCDGTPSCPPSATVNVCSLPDKRPMTERKGCNVGNRTFFTRVFPHTEDCLERTCICHDDGTWRCLKSDQDRKVC